MNDTAVPVKRTSWFGTTFWVVVGGLLLLGISFFAENLDAATIQKFLYRLDFRYWFPSLARPLWMICLLLVFDALTLRQRRADAGTWKRRFESVIFAVKLGLVIYIIYLVYNLLYPPIYRPWRLVLYAVSVLLFVFFWKKWRHIYKTKDRLDFTPEVLDVRKKFLMMSITITCELGIYDFLLLTGLRFYFSNPFWRWFGYGDYSHWAAVTFILICLATGVTIFVLKEWLMAIWRAWKVNKTTNLPQQSEVSHDT